MMATSIGNPFSGSVSNHTLAYKKTHYISVYAIQGYNYDHDQMCLMPVFSPNSSQINPARGFSSDSGTLWFYILFPFCRQMNLFHFLLMFYIYSNILNPSLCVCVCVGGGGVTSNPIKYEVFAYFHLSLEQLYL